MSSKHYRAMRLSPRYTMEGDLIQSHDRFHGLYRTGNIGRFKVVKNANGLPIVYTTRAHAERAAKEAWEGLLGADLVKLGIKLSEDVRGSSLGLKLCPFCGVDLIEVRTFRTHLTRTFVHPQDDRSLACIARGLHIIVGGSNDRGVAWNERAP